MSWKAVRLGELISQRKEFIRIDDLTEYVRCRVQLHAQGIVERDRVLGAIIKTKRQQVCRANEFLVAEIDAKVGGFGVVPPTLEGAIVSSHYFLFKVDSSRLDPLFLDYYARTSRFRNQVRAQGSTNYAAIRPGQVLDYEIPLPSVEEQRRVVARIEELSLRLGEAASLRHSACQDAVLLEASIARVAFEVGDGRKHFAIEQIAEVRGGIQKSPSRAPGANPVRYLTVAHVQRNRILLDDPRYFEVSGLELRRWRLAPGDVLIIEGNGSSEQIGRAALFRGEIRECVHQNHVIRVRPDPRVIDPEYLNAYLNSPAGQEEVQSRSRTTSGLRSLSVGRIKSIEVPVPDLVIQRRVVSRLGALTTVVRNLLSQQTQTALALQAFLPALLEKAFTGPPGEGL
jgi:type I restriction enzyme S subunit